MMKKITFSFLLFLCISVTYGQHTFSIVAVDPVTGELQIVQLFKIEHSYPSKQETYEVTVTIFVLSVVLWCILRQMY